MVTSRHDEWSYCDKGAQETIQICGKTGFRFISFTARGTNSYFNKAIPFFVSLLFPSLPFSTTVFFSCCFHHGYEKASSASSKTTEDLLKKTLHYQSHTNIRKVMFMSWFRSLIECGNYVQFCHAPSHYLSTSTNVCVNFLKRCPLRIQQPF